MRKYFFVVIAAMLAVGCIENDPILFKDAIAEFDATVWNAPAVGVNYPIITRVVGFGRAATTADPLIARNTGTMNVRINLVSAQFATDQVLNISVVNGATTAVAGTHYNIPATVTVPANSSFALLPVTIVNPVTGIGSVDLVVQIDGNETVKPSENFKRLGIRIPLN